MLKLRLSVSLCAFIFVLSRHVTADDQDGSASLLYCNGNGIRSFNFASHRDSTLMSGIEYTYVVDYHFKNKVFFWPDGNSINKAPLWQEGARPSVLIESNTYYGLAVDWIHNLIYWTNNNRIEVARLDGSMMRTVLKEERVIPSSIVLNPAEGFMFWSDVGNIKKIERCNMDGSNRKVIVNVDISLPYGLAIDLDSRSIFWVDNYLNYLSAAKFDGNHRLKLIQNLKRPFSLDIYGQYVYFVTFQSNHEAVYKVSKVDGSGLTRVFYGESSLRGLKVFHPSKQPEGFNVCGDNNGGCSHLCLPTSGHTFSCACPNDRNISSDNFTCLNSDGSVVTTPSMTITSPTTQLPFTVFQTNFSSSTGSVVTTSSLATTSPLPFTVIQSDLASSTEENKNKSVDTTSGIHGTLAVVIASVALIAMVGMMIYFRSFLMKNISNADTTNPVQKKNAEENMYMEALA